MNESPDMPDFALCRFTERVCIMREGNNIPDSAPTPLEIIKEATKQAEEEIKLWNQNQN